MALDRLQCETKISYFHLKSHWFFIKSLLLQSNVIYEQTYLDPLQEDLEPSWEELLVEKLGLGDHLMKHQLHVCPIQQLSRIFSSFPLISN